jgi:hypothetical protein
VDADADGFADAGARSLRADKPGRHSGGLSELEFKP